MSYLGKTNMNTGVPKTVFRHVSLGRAHGQSYFQRHSCPAIAHVLQS